MGFATQIRGVGRQFCICTDLRGAREGTPRVSVTREKYWDLYTRLETESPGIKGRPTFGKLLGHFTGQPFWEPASFGYRQRPVLASRVAFER